MEAATVSGGPAPTGSKTIADLLPLAVAAHGAASAVQYKDDSGGWVTRTFDEVGEIVRALSLGLIELGIEPGDKVSILANTRPEWSYFDFAALTAGAIVVPIYQSNSPEECAYVLENSDAKAVIVEDEEQMEKIREVRDSAKKLEHVIRMTGASDDAISMEELTKRGSARADSDWEERWRAVKPDDICTFIYTSGTTGPPKGCVISHANYRAMVEMAAGAEVLETGKTTYLYLPLAHSFALLIQLLSFEVGGVIAYWERDPQRIVPNLAEVRPHYFPSVPRIFEKIYAAATGGAEQAGGVKKKLFDWAIGVGRKAKDRERSGRSLGAALKLQHALADRLVLSKIRALFGGRLITAVAGAAPINAEILRFFHAADVLVLEGWGMTETSTAATISMPSAYKFGTVGKPFKGCEVKIAADGELAFVPIIIVQDGTVREQMRYPSLCTHFVDRSDDLWAQLRPLLVELLQIEPGAESREETTAKSGANSAPLIDRQTPSTLSRSLQRLDRALVHLESAVERSTADVVRPSADCVDAVFEQFARSDEPAESALAATATKQRNITRKDEAKTGAFTFPLAATTPRAFAPPQVP
jgi:long-chain acyl-CoA synthetase